jgi:hypothetical protein
MTENREHDTIESKIGDSIEDLRLKTAESLEDAARKLRDTDFSATGDEISKIVHDVQGSLKGIAPKGTFDIEAMGSDVRDTIHDTEEKIRSFAKNEEAEFGKRVESIESFISDHPIASVAFAAGAGLFVALIASKLR